jgi:O-antigen/teichoic acid export membrane protein
MMMLAAYIAVSAYKVFLLVSGKSVYWFAVVYAIEFGIIGLSLLGIYFKQGGKPLRFSWSMAKHLFSGSRPYIFSSLMVTLFHNTDHVMLKMISGDAENGFYSAAITSASVVSFVYTAIIDSMRPVILANKKQDSEEYGKNLSTLYCIIVYLALAQGLVFTLLAKPIVWMLYGAEYMQTASVLQVLVWYISFSEMGRIRNIWILSEGKQKILWKINLVGALLNIAINAVLIPIWGAFGAAFASFVTQAFTNFVLGFVVKTLRENNRLLLEGINPKFAMGVIRKMLHFKE